MIHQTLNETESTGKIDRLDASCELYCLDANWINHLPRYRNMIITPRITPSSSLFHLFMKTTS